MSWIVPKVRNSGLLAINRNRLVHCGFYLACFTQHIPFYFLFSCYFMIYSVPTDFSVGGNAFPTNSSAMANTTVLTVLTSTTIAVHSYSFSLLTKIGTQFISILFRILQIVQSVNWKCWSFLFRTGNTSERKYSQESLDESCAKISCLDYGASQPYHLASF